MTNQDRWNAYTDGLPCPQNFLDWTWMYVVAAALQRRVWTGPSHQPCYPNQYTILVGPPGVGKGLSIKAGSALLKHWPLEISTGAEHIAKSTEEKAIIESAVKSNLTNAKENEHQGSNKGARNTFKPLLIPVCADAITYEALVKAVADAYRYINYAAEGTDGKRIIRAYGHSSLCFLLEELSSLMRKRTHDTVNYLLGLYDCPVDYEYTTLTRGKDRVRRGCLNILAGTTPSFMSSTFDEELIGEGFTSRTFYIYAQSNRKNVMWLPSLTIEQETYKQELLDHIKRLTTIYGPCKVSTSTQTYLTEWWNDFCKNHRNRNKAPELIPFYARYNIHVQKLAMAKHFSEDAEVDDLGRPANEIKLETFQWAISFLGKEAMNMHLALKMEGNNPVAKASQKILEMCNGEGTDFVNIYLACRKYISERKQLMEAIEFLVETNQVKQVETMDETTNELKTTYQRI